MDYKEHDRVLAFDTLFTNNHIKMLKIVMPFFDASMQHYLAVYIKYLELQYTLSYTGNYHFPPSCGSFDVPSLLHDITPYCSSEEKSKVKQMEQLFSAMENYQNIMEMMAMMKEMFPEGDTGGINPDMLSGLFNGENSEMFHLFQMFQNNTDSKEEKEN